MSGGCEPGRCDSGVSGRERRAGRRAEAVSEGRAGEPGWGRRAGTAGGDGWAGLAEVACGGGKLGRRARAGRPWRRLCPCHPWTVLAPRHAAGQGQCQPARECRGATKQRTSVGARTGGEEGGLLWRGLSSVPSARGSRSLAGRRTCLGCRGRTVKQCEHWQRRTAAVRGSSERRWTAARERSSTRCHRKEGNGGGCAKLGNRKASNQHKSHFKIVHRLSVGDCATNCRSVGAWIEG
jgi:hypothetical protein